MSVIVDSQLMATHELGYTTIGEVLTHLSNKKRLVTQVLIDGQKPDLSQSAALRSRPLAGATVYIETSVPQQIAIDAINEIERQMDEADESRLVVIDHLSRNEPNKALQKLSGCFTNWHVCQQSLLQVAQLLRVDLDQITCENQSLNATLGQLSGQLRQIKQSIESRDYVTLSDVLQYEITETIRLWRMALGQIRSVVA